MASDTNQNRLAALDWMRGIVMVLMALDHASAFYNPGRLAVDSAATYLPGSDLPLDQFLTRWVTHICAPTFLFLAGTSLALSCRRLRAQGKLERTITRDIAIRGIIICSLDIFWVSYLGGHGLALQVLYAIGASMVAMAWLRRLDSRVLFFLGVLWLLFGEAITVVWWEPFKGNPQVWVGLTMAPFYSESVIVTYPVVPWLAVMMLGWVFGSYLFHQRSLTGCLSSAARLSMYAGLFLLLAYALVRGANGYGNMLLPRSDGTLAQWLHVSKYPPSLSYLALELGLMAVMVSVFLWIAPRIKPSVNNPLLVFGQTALFFYITHFAVLGGPAMLFDLGGKGTLTWAYYGAVMALVVLYPICRVYRNYKFRHSSHWTRFI